MTKKGRSVPSGSEDVKPLELCRDDRRKLYGLLDADVPARVRRIELSVYAIIAVTAARTIGGIPVEQLPSAFIHLFVR